MSLIYGEEALKIKGFLLTVVINHERFVEWFDDVAAKNNKQIKRYRHENH